MQLTIVYFCSYEHEFVNRIVEMAYKDVAVVMNTDQLSAAKISEVEDDSDLREYMANNMINSDMLKAGPVIIRDPAKWGPSWKPRLAPKPDP